MPDIITLEDVYKMLDAKAEGVKWDTFYTERKRPAPFLESPELPDENLKDYFEGGRIRPGKVLELGCGEGRNAVFLAKQGCSVTAVDSSQTAIQNAAALAQKQSVNVQFICNSVFELPEEKTQYDFIYDSGLLHHLAPHRRLSYIELVNRKLKSGGYLGWSVLRLGKILPMKWMTMSIMKSGASVWHSQKKSSENCLAIRWLWWKSVK